MKTQTFVSCMLALAVSACAMGNEPVGEDSEPLVIDRGDIAIDEGGVFDPGPNLYAEARLTSGRLAQLPVSWYYEANLTSSTGLHVRTVCNGDEDNTGLIVRGRGLAKFNDNSTSAGGNGMGSYVRYDAPTTPVNESFTLDVFSMRRGTSYCRVEYSRNAGSSWTVLGSDFFGGMLVDVGPLRAGDTLEMQAGTNVTDNLTRLVLFSPTDETRGARSATSGGLGGWNPRVSVPDNAWRDGTNWVLVGKRSRSNSSNTGVETRADLVRGPLKANYTEAALGTWRWLDVGRYYGWVHSKTTAPVGTTAGYNNPADAVTTDWTCDGDYNRGRLDRYAFTMRLEKQSSTGAATVSQTRRVRLAQMGAAANEYNAHLLSFDVSTPAYYRMTATAEDSTVSFFASWRAERNPDASEVRAVSYNTLYDDGHNHHNKTLNAANLLATRGRIYPASMQMLTPQDQAPFQWEADVIGLQEFRKGAVSANPSTQPALATQQTRSFVDLFRGEAQFMGSRAWGYVWGRDEEFSFTTDGLGPVFVASTFYPSTTSASIDFTNAALDEAGCGTSAYDPTLVQCDLDEDGWSIGSDFNAIPSRISVRRFGNSNDRPIVVVNVHLRSDDHFSDRSEELDDLIGTLKTLLEEQPTAFNAEGATSPMHYQNRIIIMGDMNISAHHCGEHYWFLRKLRDNFGYALDAAGGGQGDYDMHDQAGSFANFVSFNDWDANPSLPYPWYLASYRGKDADGGRRTERYDAIMLVGKGWAYDDPVTEYQVMNDRSASHSMAPSGFAVEQWAASNLVTNGYDSTGFAKGYRPNYRLSLPPGVGSTQPFVPGEPALDSDHAPIRATLRVFQR